MDFGADTTTVLVYKNNILRYLSVLPLGGNNITHDITSLPVSYTHLDVYKRQLHHRGIQCCQYADLQEWRPLGTDRCV